MDSSNVIIKCICKVGSATANSWHWKLNGSSMGRPAGLQTNMLDSLDTRLENNSIQIPTVCTYDNRTKDKAWKSPSSSLGLRTRPIFPRVWCRISVDLLSYDSKSTLIWLDHRKKSERIWTYLLDLCMKEEACTFYGYRYVGVRRKHRASSDHKRSWEQHEVCQCLCMIERVSISSPSLQECRIVSPACTR